MSDTIPDDKIKVIRYEHGGGRIFIEREDGTRDGVVDIYDDENGERRDRIITALLRDGIITPRQR